MRPHAKKRGRVLGQGSVVEHLSGKWEMNIKDTPLQRPLINAVGERISRFCFIPTQLDRVVSSYYTRSFSDWREACLCLTPLPYGVRVRWTEQECHFVSHSLCMSQGDKASMDGRGGQHRERGEEGERRIKGERGRGPSQSSCLSLLTTGPLACTGSECYFYWSFLFY